MVTKSMASTPFGMKLIYRINDECIWSEYLSPSEPPTRGPSLLRRAGTVLGHLTRSVRAVWSPQNL